MLWATITMVALVWPGGLSGPLDGAPLQGLAEAVLIGLVVPALIWFYRAFLGRAIVRVVVLALLLVKLAATLTLPQEGWCLTFEPPRAMVRDSTGKPHAWDLRADWLADDPACSAIMTRSYHDIFEVPAWFYNLPPPDDAVTRAGFEPGEIPVRVRGAGYLSVRRPGELSLSTAPAMNVSASIDGRPIELKEPGVHAIGLEPGVHALQFEGSLLGKQWLIVPSWDGINMGSIFFPLSTMTPPSRFDRVALQIARWLAPALLVVLLAVWLAGAIASVKDRWLVVWSSAASLAAIVVAWQLPSQAPWYTAVVMALPLLIHLRRPVMNARGVFLLVIVPWLAFVCAASAHQVGRWRLYGIGNDDFQFQRFSYRIFMQGFWLEGGQVTFWNQPLFRWIAGALHMLFGDSSVGQSYWDGAGVAIIAMFAYRVVASRWGFLWGLLAAIVPLDMFLLGTGLQFVGFGLSEISSAAFIYLAAFFAMRNRGAADLMAAGLFVVLGFYARLNSLPMAAAVAGFALPLTLPAGAVWRPRVWLPEVRWRVVIAIAGALAISCLLFAWRTWHYTGVFSLFYGTQREYLAVWKPAVAWRDGASAMVSSVMMVLTGQDPPHFVWHAAPILAAAAVAGAALLNVPVLRDAPLSLVVFFASGLVGALVTRGWAYEGRFSIHLYGAAGALCCWALAGLWSRKGLVLPSADPSQSAR